MTRGYPEDNRLRQPNSATDALALLQSMAPKGRVAPIPDGTILKERYRIEHFLRGSDLRNQYVVSWHDLPGNRYCHECGNENNEESDSHCQECLSELGVGHFILSERWRTDFQPYFEVMEIGLFHSGLSRIYDVFEQGQRLFTVTEPVDPRDFLVEKGGPLSLDTLIEATLEGCNFLEYLHLTGVGLAMLDREHLVLDDGSLRLHDPEIGAVHPGEVPKEQRLQDLRYLARIMREFVRYEASSLRDVFDKACDGRYEHPAHFAAALRQERERLPQLPREMHAAAMSDVGMCRTLNEDNWGWRAYDHGISLFVVADGMGGHDGGEIASELAVRIALDGMQRRIAAAMDFDDESLETLLNDTFQDANESVKQYSEQHRSDMGTTLVGVLLRGRSSVVANVGDSRLYLIRDGEVEQISKDHSLVANLVELGKITKEAARNHPHSNILIRTVGKEWNIDVDTFPQEVESGDLLLLCSDGLWGEIVEDEILEITQKNPEPLKACEELVRTANAHGGHDNVTIVMVRIP